MRALLDEWKQHQRGGAKLDKATEGALWQRFSHARNSFDKARRAALRPARGHPGRGQGRQAGARQGGRGALDQHRLGPDGPRVQAADGPLAQAGRASRADDDALWERFKAAQDAFFAAKDEVAAAEDEEFRGNLAVKEELLTEAEAILPVNDLETAKAPLRGIQDKWERGRQGAPRRRRAHREGGCGASRQAVREADDAALEAVQPRGGGPRPDRMVDQLEASVAVARGRPRQGRRRPATTKKVKDARRPSSRPRSSGWSRPAAALDEFGRSQRPSVRRVEAARGLGGGRLGAAGDAVDVEDAVDLAAPRAITCPRWRRVAHLEGELRDGHPVARGRAPTPTGC